MMSVWGTAWKIPIIFLACGVIAIVLRAWLTDRGLQLTGHRNPNRHAILVARHPRAIRPPALRGTVESSALLR